MKLKTSFFDSAVLKKALLRFWPAWGLYLIGGLLITQTQSHDPYRIACSLGGDTALLMILVAVYGALVAFLLFGDLFKSRMCNALHALPVRREAWFVSHAVAGVLMSLVPNLVLALLLMPFSARFWYVPLLWAGEMTLIYLFCFGTAVLAIYLTGNTFAAVLVYGIFNFVTILVFWLVDQFYMPLLYGLRLNEDFFRRFSPLTYAFDNFEMWDVEHLDTCTNAGCNRYGSGYHYHSGCQYEIIYEKENWIYLAIMAAVGVAFLACSLLLYRKRKLECAGDFAAVRPMKTVFPMLGAFAAGLLFYAIVGEDGFVGYLMLLLGGIVGFFGCQMMLQRTVKVFGKKSWLKLGALVAVVAISLGLTAVDVLGITRIVPDADEVVSVTLADSHLSNNQLEQLETELNLNPNSMGSARGADPNYVYGKVGQITLTDPEQIREAIDIHKLLLAEGDPNVSNYYQSHTPVTIHYKLKNGATMTRYYYGVLTGEAVKKLHKFTNTPVYILGVGSAAELLKDLNYMHYSGDHFYDEVRDPDWQIKLADALWQDALDGNLYQSFTGGGKDYVELQYDMDGRYRYVSLMVPGTAKNTRAWAEEYYAYLQESGQIKH